MINPIVVLLAPKVSPYRGKITFNMELALKKRNANKYKRIKDQDIAIFKLLPPSQKAFKLLFILLTSHSFHIRIEATIVYKDDNFH